MAKSEFKNEIKDRRIFDNEVNVDDKLKLSKKNLTDLIRSHVSVVKLPRTEKLKSVCEFPTAQTLSLLACKVYEDLEKEKLPDGWKLLTIATNKDLSNGYVGAAFLHPENHHVVVAHRGTDPSNFGAVVADVAGIVFNNYAGQLESACTFVDKVVEAMKTVEKEFEGDVNFELFITGHSLGAWLSQVSVFSNMFLTKIDKKFKRAEQNAGDRYHANAIVFDSPGAFPMLLKMKSKFEDPENPITLEDMSITSYLSAPNQVNTCNEHFGKIFRVFIDTSKMNLIDRNVGYTLSTHSILNIVKAFESQNETKIEEVLEWPLRDGITGGDDLENFLKYADYRNSYHIDENMRETLKNIQIRYKTRKADKTLKPISIFNKREREFLECFRWLKGLPAYRNFRKILYGPENFTPELDQIFDYFDIVDENIFIEDKEKMKVFIPFVKLLLKLFPGITEKTQKPLINASVWAQIFAFESEICLKKKDLLQFKPSTLDISEFMKKQFGCLKVKSGKAWNGLSVVYQNFKASEYNKNYKESELLILDLNRFLMLQEIISFKNFLKTAKEKLLMIVYCEEKRFTSISIKQTFRKVLPALRDNPQIKIILIGETGCEFIEDISKEGMSVMQEKYYQTEECLSWNEMTLESQLKILRSEVFLQGRKEKIGNLLKSNSCLDLSDELLQQILNDSCIKINTDPLIKSDFSLYVADHEKKEIKPKHILESLEVSEDIFFISGIYDEDPQVIYEQIKKILLPETLAQENLIIQNINADSETFGENCGKLQITSLIGSDRCLADFEQKCRQYYGGKKSIHWLKIKEGKLTWRKSYNYRAYIERKMKIDGKVVEDSEVPKIKDKVVAVVGKCGEGKSSFLNYLAREKSKSSWIIHMNLEDVSFGNLKIDLLNGESLNSFIANTVGYDSENHLQSFAQKLQMSSVGEYPIHFFFDGFDRIENEKDRNKALKLIKFIRDNTNCCITLTSVDSFKNALNDLQPTFCTFEKMERVEREKLLKEFWKSRFAFVWGPKKCLEVFDQENSKFKSFVNIFSDNLNSNIEKAGEVMGIPQQIHCLAQSFQEDFEKYVKTNAIHSKVFDCLKVSAVYSQYVKIKYDVTAKAKLKKIEREEKSFLKSLEKISLVSLEINKH